MQEPVPEKSIKFIDPVREVLCDHLLVFFRLALQPEVLAYMVFKVRIIGSLHGSLFGCEMIVCIGKDVGADLFRDILAAFITDGRKHRFYEIDDFVVLLVELFDPRIVGVPPFYNFHGGLICFQPGLFCGKSILQIESGLLWLSERSSPGFPAAEPLRSANPSLARIFLTLSHYPGDNQGSVEKILFREASGMPAVKFFACLDSQTKILIFKGTLLF